MAIRDTYITGSFVEDRDDNVFVGIDLPFRKSDGRDGWFASTSTTIEAVKNNIRNLLQTEQNERFFQPLLGVNLRKYIFEQVSEDNVFKIQEDILDIFKLWLPFVEIRNIRVSIKDSDKNTLNLFILFNIKQDPNTLESVQIEIGE